MAFCSKTKVGHSDEPMRNKLLIRTRWQEGEEEEAAEGKWPWHKPYAKNQRMANGSVCRCTFSRRMQFAVNRCKPTLSFSFFLSFIIFFSFARLFRSFQSNPIHPMTYRYVVRDVGSRSVSNKRQNAIGENITSDRSTPERFSNFNSTLKIEIGTLQLQIS